MDPLRGYVSVILYFHFFLILRHPSSSFFFFFNDTATTEIYTLSLHDALPICRLDRLDGAQVALANHPGLAVHPGRLGGRSEEHTSELQSQSNLVCRLLLEKKKKRATRVLGSLVNQIAAMPRNSTFGVRPCISV